MVRQLTPARLLTSEVSARLTEFAASGAVALCYPEPAPADLDGRLALLAQFGRMHKQFEVLTSSPGAFERRVVRAFGTADELADAILLQRIEDDGAVEAASALRYLRDAHIAESANEYIELALDRRALLEQASPWRYFEARPFAGALAAVAAWRTRYRVAYEAHYALVVAQAAAAREEVQAARPRAEALARLDDIAALGAPVGGVALGVFAAAEAALAAFPDTPDLHLARAGGVTLGAPPAQCAAAGDAIAQVSAAFEVQRRRLAERATALVLAREDVPALDRLLQAITASSLDGLERVLDDQLARHIEALLASEVSS